MTFHLRRDTPEYRVLVELAGQARAMTLKELFDETGISPEKLHDVARDLYYATNYLRIDWRRADTYNVPGDLVYSITWEGQEALRRLDELPESAGPHKKRRWWR